MSHQFGDESLVPILSAGNELETQSLSTRVSSRSETSIEENSITIITQSSHTSCLAAIFLTVNATLGAGLLNIPHAFNDSGGIFYASIVQTVFVILIIGSLILLTHCTNISNARSYQELVLSFCGVKCQHLCSLIIILYSYGACITFVIIIGDQFDRSNVWPIYKSIINSYISIAFLSLYGSDFDKFWYMNRSFTMSATCALLVLPLSFSKKIGFLKNASLLGFCATFYLIFLVVFQYFKTDTQNVIVKTEPKSWTEVFYITPVLCFAYQCQLSWIPTYAGMRQRSGSIKIMITIIISILICYLSYTLTAIFGLITFGSEYIENDLMSNYNANNWVVLLGIIILIAKTITVYPLLLFCGRVAVEDFIQNISNLFGPNLSICCHSLRFELYRRAIIVLLWVFSTVVIAIFIPNITIAIEYLGSFAALFVFIFPGLCFLASILIKDRNLYLLKDKIYIFIASLYIIIGVFLFTFINANNIQKKFI